MTLYLHERKYELDSLCAGTVSRLPTKKRVLLILLAKSLIVCGGA
jgi:hypothetical protein